MCRTGLLVLFVLMVGLSGSIAGCASVSVSGVSRGQSWPMLKTASALTVLPFSLIGIQIAGDHGSAAELEAAKSTWPTFMAGAIVRQLDGALNARVALSPPTEGLVLEGTFVEIDAGSGAARALVGLGAGQSKVVVFVRIYDAMNPEDVLGTFEAIGGSKGSGGLFQAGNQTESDMNNAAESIAKFLKAELRS